MTLKYSTFLFMPLFYFLPHLLGVFYFLLVWFSPAIFSLIFFPLDDFSTIPPFPHQLFRSFPVRIHSHPTNSKPLFFSSTTSSVVWFLLFLPLSCCFPPFSPSIASPGGVGEKREKRERRENGMGCGFIRPSSAFRTSHIAFVFLAITNQPLY